MKTQLPNFLIVGAAKSGTTSLHNYLNAHTNICMAEQKETFFLTGKSFKNINEIGNNYGRNAVTTLSGYLNKFQKCKNYQIRGEACVAYLYYYKSTIKNILNYLDKKVKIIIILRNPIERAFSNYLHHVRDGFETLSFEEALNKIDQRMIDNWWWGYDYLGVGLYYRQVKAYLENFDNVKIYLFDDLKKDRLGLIQNVYNFLEVDEQFIPSNLSQTFNVSGIPRNKLIHYLLNKNNLFTQIVKSIAKGLIKDKQQRQMLINKIVQKNLEKPTMKSSTKQYLKDFYREDILRLQDLIKINLTHWVED